MAYDAYEIWLRETRRKLSAAVEQCQPLLAAGRYDEAEKAVTAVDGDIYGAIAVAGMYTEALRKLVASGGQLSDRALAIELFSRALHWKQSAYPEPHTQVEADSYWAGRAEDYAALVKILGYDPTQPAI